MPAFQATGSSKPSEVSLPQPPYIVLDAAPIHGVPIEDLALRSVHLTVSNLPIGSGISNQLLLTGSPDPRQLPFGPGTPPVSDQLCGNHSAEGPIHGFPVSCRLSTVGVRFLGPPAPAGELHLPHGRPTGHHHAGPQRGCHVAHEQDSTGQGAPFTPGTVVRSRPATILRPAPRRFPAASPYGPADTSHRRGSPSRGVIGGSLAFAHHPKTTGCRPGAGKRHRFPPVFSWPAAPGWNGSRFGLDPGLRTPRSPAEHAEAETRPLRTGPSTTPMASAKPPNGASHFTHAPSCRT